ARRSACDRSGGTQAVCRHLCHSAPRAGTTTCVTGINEGGGVHSYGTAGENAIATEDGVEGIKQSRNPLRQVPALKHLVRSEKRGSFLTERVSVGTFCSQIKHVPGSKNKS